MARESPMQTTGAGKGRVKLAEPDSVSVGDHEAADDDTMDKDNVLVPRHERKNGAYTQVSTGSVVWQKGEIYKLYMWTD